MSRWSVSNRRGGSVPRATIATLVPPSSIAKTVAAQDLGEIAQVRRDVVARHVHVIERAERDDRGHPSTIASTANG